MKIYFIVFLFYIFVQPSFCLENKIYSISVCTTSSKEAANRCKENISKNTNIETFIQENLNKSYSTYLGKFTTYDETKKVLNNSSDFVKKQKPFIKIIKNYKEIEITAQNTQENKNVEKRILEIDKIINKIDKALEEVQRIEKEKVLSDEQRKRTEIEIQKEQEIRKKIETEAQKMKAEVEEKRIKDEQEITEKFRKEKEEKEKAFNEIQKIKNERDKALEEVQRIEKEKNLSDEQRKKTEIEIQKEQEIRKKIETEAQKMKAEVEEKRIKEEQEVTEKFRKEKEENNSQKINELNDFENLIIKVDSTKNIMLLKGKDIKGKITDIKTYKVSTAKNSIKKPLGIGSITSISLNPQWHPTDKTLKAFREKGINLPSVVPFGHKLNYMGAAKINLTHRVNGQEVYRIHGTISEETIGTYESSGCIRMKNKEVTELATLLENFSKAKSLNNISVILE